MVRVRLRRRKGSRFAQRASSCASDDMSITKRYFTSLLSIRSYASLMYWIGITSTSEVMPCLPQKSSISCVSLSPPMSEPDTLRRPKIRLKADGPAFGLGGTPSSTSAPSRLSSVT
jgi:hypothetical protein